MSIGVAFREWAEVWRAFYHPPTQCYYLFFSCQEVWYIYRKEGVAIPYQTLTRARAALIRQFLRDVNRDERDLDDCVAVALRYNLPVHFEFPFRMDIECAKHLQGCQDGKEEVVAFEAAHPNYCRTCRGTGILYEKSSYGDEWDENECTACLLYSLCPWCLTKTLVEEVENDMEYVGCSQCSWRSGVAYEPEDYGAPFWDCICNQVRKEGGLYNG